jgi:uncharacterized membrane protein YcaP (DUF421 family)
MPGYVQIALRAILSYLVLLVLTRLMGKRELSQMTYFDYIVGITIGSLTASMAMETSKGWLDLLPALLIFGAFQIISAFISIKSFGFRKLVNSSPTILVDHGKILERNMLRERLSMSEFTTKLREKNAFKLADVEFAILEPDGQLSVQLKAPKQPVTPSDLRISAQYNGIPRIVIESGNVRGESLRNLGLTRAWLMSKLAEQGVYDYSKVMAAQVDTSGSLYVDLYDDFIDAPKPDTSDQMTLAKLEKIHSDFSSYYLETQNEEAKKLYKQCESIMENVIAQYKYYLDQKIN